MDWVLVLITLSLLEGFLLQRTVFVDLTFRTVTLSSVGVNLVLVAVWNTLIYPYFITPLRHLPTISVGLTAHYHVLRQVTNGDRAISTMPVLFSMIPVAVCRWNG